MCVLGQRKGRAHHACNMRNHAPSPRFRLLLSCLHVRPPAPPPQVATAARSLIGAFRDINPEMLAKKDRGRGADMGEAGRGCRWGCRRRDGVGGGGMMSFGEGGGWVAARRHWSPGM